MQRLHTWYVGWPYGVHGPYCFWAQSKVIWGQQRSKSKNLVNTIASELKGAETSYLVCGMAIWSTWSLLFLGPVQGHLGSTEVQRLGQRWPYGVHGPYCFWAQSKVIWGQQRSKSKHLVNTIASELKGAETSYLVFGMAIWSTWSLLFLGPVQGHLGSTEVKV